jgi:transposase
VDELEAHIASLKAHPELGPLLAPLFALIEAQAARIVELEAQVARVAELEAEVAELKARLAQTSETSHKPPSSDGYRKKPAIPRVPGTRGGQKGHRGNTLKMVATPDTVDTKFASACSGCGHRLSEADVIDVESRQVFDLPEPRLQVHEYRRGRSRCRQCGSQTQAPFPDHVRAPVQYGAGVQALCTLLHNDYHVPVAKVGQLFMDLFDQRVNEATVLAANARTYEALAASETAIRAGLKRSALLHVDETGIRAQGRLNWLHSASNASLSYYFIHHKRGKKALASEASLLPGYRGRLVHDCWASYFCFTEAEHSLCAAHLIRELRALAERGACWAEEMIELFLEAYRLIEETAVLGRRTYYQFKHRYFALLRQGLQKHPPLPKKPGQRGRRKRGKARSLILRLIRYHEAVWAFACHGEVPFTNNQAERDLRMAKLKQKINGGFRTEQGARVFARIRGFCSTARKQGKQVFKELTQALHEPDYCIPLSST